MKRLTTAMCMVASLMGIASAGAVATAPSATAASPDDYLNYPAENQKVIDKWNSLGRETGPLGQPLTYLACESGGISCVEESTSGFVYSNINQPTANVIYKYMGQAGPYWLQNVNNIRGALGPATSDEKSSAMGGLYQDFRNGRILWSYSTGVRSVTGSIAAAYKARMGENGPLGYPLADVVGMQGGSLQKFQGGTIYQTSGLGAGTYTVPSEVRSKYEAMGAQSGSLGWPVTDYVCVTVGGTCNQQFQYGYINVTGLSATAYPTAPFTKECQTLNNNMGKYSGGGANRVSFAIAEGYGQFNAQFTNCRKTAHGFYTTDWTAPATVGQSGFMYPGQFTGPTYNKFSPTGSYSVTEAFGLSNPGTQLPYRTLNPMSRWGGNPGSWNYNQYFEGYSFGYDENMWDFATMPSHDYAQGAVINYNRPPDAPSIVQGAGFAIFLHGNRVPTAGCIALDDAPLRTWLQTATPDDRIIMGVRSDLFYP